MIRMALRRYNCRERALATLGCMIRQGDDDIEAGRHAPMEEVFARLRAELIARTKTLRRELDPAVAEYARGEIIPGPLAVEQARAEFRRRFSGEPARNTG